MKKAVVIVVLILSTLGVLFFFSKDRSAEPPETGGNADPVELVEREEELVVTKWESVNQTNVTIQGLMDMYEEWSGERVVGESEILKEKISFVMRGPFTPTEGVVFLKMTLKLNGFEILENEGQLSITEAPFQLTESQRLEAATKPNLENELSEELRISAGQSMSFPGITVLAAAQIFEDISGKRVIQSEVTAYSDFSFSVVGPAINEKVATEIWKSLNEVGYGFIEVPEHENLLWLVVVDEEKVAEARKNKSKPRGRRMRYVPRPK